MKYSLSILYHNLHRQYDVRYLQYKKNITDKLSFQDNKLIVVGKYCKYVGRNRSSIECVNTCVPT